MKASKGAFFLLLFSQAVLAAGLGLSDFDGNAHSLNDYLGKGRWTVVQIWAHDCHMCNREAPDVKAFNTRMQKAGLARVIGISADGEEGFLDAQAYIERHGIDYPNLIAEPMAVAVLMAKYAKARFVGTPTYMVFDREGEFRGGDAGAIPMDIIEKFIRERDEKAG